MVVIEEQHKKDMNLKDINLIELLNYDITKVIMVKKIKNNSILK